MPCCTEMYCNMVCKMACKMWKCCNNAWMLASIDTLLRDCPLCLVWGLSGSSFYTSWTFHAFYRNIKHLFFLFYYKNRPMVSSSMDFLDDACKVCLHNQTISLIIQKSLIKIQTKIRTKKGTKTFTFTFQPLHYFYDNLKDKWARLEKTISTVLTTGHQVFKPIASLYKKRTNPRNVKSQSSQLALCYFDIYN